jgi:hypothetical protein
MITVQVTWRRDGIVLTDHFFPAASALHTYSFPLNCDPVEGQRAYTGYKLEIYDREIK